MSRQLLPPNRTPLEAAIADALIVRADPAPLRGMADSTRCPVPFLPVLAWERCVDIESAATVQQQRALIASALPVHQVKGTIHAVRQTFRDLGLGEVEIDEGTGVFGYDGAAAFDGFASYGDPDGWAEYRVRIDKLLSVAQAEAARRILYTSTPTRCVLWGIDFTGAELIYNDMAAFDGGYSFGVA